MLGQSCTRRPRPRSRNQEGRRRPARPHVTGPLAGRAVFSAGGFAARPAWQPDPRHGRGRRAATRLYPRGVVDSPLSGAGGLSEAGLGGRRPDRMRAARPYALLHEQEVVLNSSGGAFMTAAAFAPPVRAKPTL